MKLPCSWSDFATLINEGCFYQDRTDRIPLLEEAGSSQDPRGARFQPARQAERRFCTASGELSH
jgi:hypothetical protein